MTRNSTVIMIFLKRLISARGGHCAYSFRSLKTTTLLVDNYYYYYYYYYSLQLSFHSVAVTLTLVTNKNKYTQTKQCKNTVQTLQNKINTSSGRTEVNRDKLVVRADV
jgi:hypothetical protein